MLQKKAFVLFFSFCALNFQSLIAQDSARSLTLLSLGDSYTIGEKLSAEERFPNQVDSILSAQNIQVEKPVIIATTGWTTGELMQGISNAHIHRSFDFVTLLIGVNNQYRGLSLNDYKTEFKQLLTQSISFAGGNHQHVIVLSIPDWGATPFAAGSDRGKIAGEIDAFNAVNREETEKMGAHYIEITSLTREHPDWIAEDGLHPNGSMYFLWAQKIAEVISSEIK